MAERFRCDLNVLVDDMHMWVAAEEFRPFDKV